MTIQVLTDTKEWEHVKSAALLTIHKKAAKDSLTASEWKHAMLLARHSPLREFRIRVIIEDLPRWIADQLVRHTVGVNNFMATMRPDRTKRLLRDQQSMADLTTFQQTYNIDSFLSMCRTRLCVGAVSKETREVIQNVVQILSHTEPEIAMYCAPPCIHQGGCKEKALCDLTNGKHCNVYQNFAIQIENRQVFDLKDRFTFYKNYCNS